MNAHQLSDDRLYAFLRSMCRLSRRVDARIVELLVEAENRRLDLKMACPSLWDLCVRKLGMTEGTTQRRIEAARLVRRIPQLLPPLLSGKLSVGRLALLRGHITEQNADFLVERAAGRSRREIEELLVSVKPREDVPAEMRRLPSRVPAPTVSTTPSTAPPVTGVVGATTLAATQSSTPPEPAVAPAPAPAVASPPERRPKLEPLAPSRWRLQITADQHIHDQILRAQALMRHRNPSGDLTAIVAAALDLLVEKLEKERLGVGARSVVESADTSTDTALTQPRKAIPRATRQAVFARDGMQCSFVGENGERCPSTSWLELDHVVARALGGDNSVDNLCVRCRAHNSLRAEQDFGREHIERKIAERRARVSSDDESRTTSATTRARGRAGKERRITSRTTTRVGKSGGVRSPSSAT